MVDLMQRNMHRTGKLADWELTDSTKWNKYQKVADRTNGIITPANLISLAGLALTIQGARNIAKKNDVKALTQIGLGRALDIADGFVVHNSTRYCCYAKEKFGNEITVIEPPSLSPEAHRVWSIACENAEFSYLDLIKNEVPAQIARSVLPTCLKTEIIMTANFREWRHFLKLRTAPAAHPQMREVAGMIYLKLVGIAPSVFSDLVVA